MLQHSEIWRAIDLLADQRGMSPSGLAKRAGLDPTTFNKSKRITRDGKLRWPSTESISKILQASGATMGEFISLLNENSNQTSFQKLPLIGMAQAGAEGYFDDAGYPAGSGWDEVVFPDARDEHAYALEIAGDSMEPVFRDGDVIIVSPLARPRRGDRVVVKTRAGEVMAKLLRRQTAQRIELVSFNPAHEDRVIAVEDLDWIARITWVSQ
ncbi:MAG TPA: helix-turn-helix transcriptional regulator [Rhodospirillales bacterium]|nr:helix-turn-helix transcriptional regulator [Rhodospirillales bacterium]